MTDSTLSSDEELIDVLKEAGAQFEVYEEYVRVATLAAMPQTLTPDGLRIDTMRYPVGLVLRTVQ